MSEVGLEPYLFLGAVLFVCGAVCMATKRNAIGVLIGVELVLNGANINLVAFTPISIRPSKSRWTHDLLPCSSSSYLAARRPRSRWPLCSTSTTTT